MHLRFVSYLGNKRLGASNRPREGVSIKVKENVWEFAGGSYQIGHGVRCNDHGELPIGPIFVYNFDNPKHHQQLTRIQQELCEYGHLVIA